MWMDDEVKMIHIEAQSSYYPGICLERLRKATKTLSIFGVLAEIQTEHLSALLLFGVIPLRAAAHQLRQDKHQDMRQKRQKLTSES
jgi:hypothetical protein